MHIRRRRDWLLCRRSRSRDRLLDGRELGRRRCWGRLGLYLFLLVCYFCDKGEGEGDIYTPIIITLIEIRNAQSLPTQLANGPPIHNCAKPNSHVSVYAPTYQVKSLKQDIPVVAQGIVAITPCFVALTA